MHHVNQEDHIDQPTTTTILPASQNENHDEVEQKEESTTNTNKNNNDPEMKNLEYQIQRKVYFFCQIFNHAFT